MDNNGTSQQDVAKWGKVITRQDARDMTIPRNMIDVMHKPRKPITPEYVKHERARWRKVFLRPDETLPHFTFRIPWEHAVTCKECSNSSDPKLNYTLCLLRGGS